MIHDCNSHTHEAKAGRMGVPGLAMATWRIQDQSGLHRKFKDSLSNIMRHFLTITTEREWENISL